MKKYAWVFVLIYPFLLVTVGCGNKNGNKVIADKVNLNASLSCHLDTQFASFKDSIFTLSTVFGLHGSNACWPDTIGNPPYQWDTTIYLKKGRNKPYDSVFWFPTDLGHNLKNFDLSIYQNLKNQGICR